MHVVASVMLLCAHHNLELGPPEPLYLILDPHTVNLGTPESLCTQGALQSSAASYVQGSQVSYCSCQIGPGISY
jgi:hypothetical protein